MIKFGLILLLFLVSSGLFYLVFSYSLNSTSSMISPERMVTSQVERSMGQKVYEPIDLEKIFDGRLEAVVEREKIVLLVTGDVIPARSVNYQATVRNNFLWPYEKIAATVANSDLTFINLETPLLKICPLTQEGMVFCGSDKHIEGLKLMGVDVVSVANNHAGNHGRDGLTETINLLESNNIAVTGDQEPVIKTVKGVTFAFLGFNDIPGGVAGMQQAEEENIRKRIAEVREKADVVVVTYHWGAEYQAQPDARQRYLGHLTIDAGADLVVANHPHWVQPVEIYQSKVIMYAHGNTIFDQEWSAETKQGVLGKYVFGGKQLVGVEYIPIGLKDYGQAFIADVPLKSSILDKLRLESEILSKKR